MLVGLPMMLSMLSVAMAGNPPSSGAKAVLQAKRGELLLHGTRWRGIGVNYFDAFLRALRNPRDTSYEEGFRILDSMDVPFVRLAMSGLVEKDMELYRTDKEAYFRRMDGVVAAARRHGIGLVPCLIWRENLPTLVTGEPLDSLTDTNSVSARWARDYVSEVVARYRDDPTIWMWEVGNEFYPFGDLPKNNRYHNPMTTRATAALLRMLANAIRSKDPSRLISSGNQIPMDNQYHRFLYREDTTRLADIRRKDDSLQHKAVIAMLHPDPIDVVSCHLYGFNRVGGWTGNGVLPPRGEIEYFKLLVKMGRELGKPTFLGEFGVNKKDVDERGLPLDASGQQALFERTVDGIVAAEIPISALWVFDFSHFSNDGAWDVFPGQPRGYQLEVISRANRRMSRGLAAKTTGHPRTEEGGDHE